MALELQNILEIEVDGSVFWITDDTGQYDVNNLGGFGAPNEEIADICLFIFSEQIEDSGNTVVTVLSGQFATGLATFDHVFQLTLAEDGHYKTGMFSIPVSTDGVVTLAGATIVTDDIVFYQGKVQKYNGATFDEITDFTLLYDEPNVAQVVRENLIYPDVMIARSALWKTYRDKRIENCEDLSDELKEIQILDLDIQGMEYDFRRGQLSTARVILEELKAKYVNQ